MVRETTAEELRWYAAVEAEIENLTDMSMDDLPDFCYADAYIAHRSPKSTARAAIRAAQD